MAALFQAFRHGIRGVPRDPSYAVTVIVTLALTLGATTAAFSIVDGVLLKPLSYPDAGRLVELQEVWREFEDKIPTVPMNARHFEYWRAHAGSFDTMAQYVVLPENLTGPGDASQVSVAHASGSVFDVLQPQMSLGRPLVPSDEPSSAPDVAVISDALWRQRFGGDARALGRPVLLGGKPYTVVGVLPPGFRLPLRSRLVDTVDVFVAIRMDAERGGWAGEHNYFAVGRLAAGATLAQARAELHVLQEHVSERATADAGEPVTLAAVVTPLADTIVGSSRRALLLLLASIAGVLLIACSNLANLSLTRTIARLRDAAIRVSLGATPARLVTQALVEQLVLAVSGGALGLVVAWMALRLFVRTAPIDLPRAADVALDLRVLAFAAVAALLGGLLIAVFPAWRLGRGDVQHRLRAGTLALTSDRGSMRSRAALVAAQVALSLMLLVVTALIGSSFLRLLAVDRGFEPEGVLVVPIALPAERYAEDALRVATYDRLLGAVRGIPGVRSATTTSLLPLGGEGQVNFIVAEGRPVPLKQQPTANFRFVAPDFFTTLGIRVRSGRAFTDGERGPGRPTPALLSESAAARVWPGEDPLGRHFSRGVEGEAGFEVVGVVSDARTTSVERTPPLMVYVPYWWRSRSSSTLLVKTAVDPALVLPSVRDIVRRLDPQIAIGPVRSMNDVVESAFGARRYQVRLFVVFGIAALALATLGVYAVTSYDVARRRREMNIRVALGARERQVLGLVLRQGTAPVAVGLLAGVAGALAGSSLVASLLYDVAPRDPLVIGSVVGVVALAGAAACVVAARQALVIEPARALRED